MGATSWTGMSDTYISSIMSECLASSTDEGAVHVKVESLMNFEAWVYPEVAKRNFDIIIEHVKKLPKKFLDAEKGHSFGSLIEYENGQQWGSYVDAGCLVALCSFYGIFQDPLHTLGFKSVCLKELWGEVTYCSFNIEPNFIDFVKVHLGIK